LVRALLVLLVLSTGVGAATPAPPSVERNVVYGMASGAALLLDIHRPAKSNGLGVIFISGSGWQASTEYGAAPLKEQQIGLWGPPLTAAGYTVFALNHRAAPRFHYPAPVEDVQRAIRFVRHHANEFGIDPTRLGGVGGSSGGHLIALAAMLASPGIAHDADPVNRESAALQAVVLRAPVLDLRTVDTIEGTAYVVSFMEAPPSQVSARVAYEAGSPITHVNPKSPPVLLLHGDADKIIPYAQSKAMKEALEAANVAVELVTIPGGAHAPDFGSAQGRSGWPNYFGAMISWLDRHLKPTAE
jgi:acetyl esterase/lipase